MTNTDLTQVSARLSEDTVAWLDARVQAMKREHPAMRVTRSDALRDALEDARNYEDLRK